MISNFISQVDFLEKLCDSLLPGDTERQVPSFSQLKLTDKLIEKCDVSLVSDAHRIYHEIAKSLFLHEGCDPIQLQKSYLLLREEMNVRLNPILREVINLYYSNRLVTESLGLNRSLPFPKGIRLEEIDYDLLVPVVERGQKYRVPGKQE